MTANGRAITGDADSRSLFVGDVVEGAVAAEQVAAGNAEAIEEAVAPAAVEEVPEVDATQGALDHAKALGVDIAAIKGSGKDGRVLKADVEAAVAAKEGA